MYIYIYVDMISVISSQLGWRMLKPTRSRWGFEAGAGIAIGVGFVLLLSPWWFCILQILTLTELTSVTVSFRLRLLRYSSCWPVPCSSTAPQHSHLCRAVSAVGRSMDSMCPSAHRKLIGERLGKWTFIRAQAAVAVQLRQWHLDVGYARQVGINQPMIRALEAGKSRCSSIFDFGFRISVLIS